MIINWSEGTNTAINAHPVLFTPSGVVGAIIQTLQRIRTATLRVLMARVQVLDVALFRSLTLKILSFRAHVAPVAVVSRARTLEMLDERQKGIGI